METDELRSEEADVGTLYKDQKKGPVDRSEMPDMEEKWNAGRQRQVCPAKRQKLVEVTEVVVVESKVSTGEYEMFAAERIDADLRNKRGLCTKMKSRTNVAQRHLEAFHVRKKKIDWIQNEIRTYSDLV